MARNGPEFENVTKLKQKDNPKFNFLFGGEHFNFYQYRLSVEREACITFDVFKMKFQFETF